MAAVLARQGRLKGPVWTVGQLVPLIVGILAAGVYQLMIRISSVPHNYHAVFGAKLLMVMHIAAVLLLTTKPEMEEAKRARLLTGAAVSGLGVLLLSAVLRAF